MRSVLDPSSIELITFDCYGTLIDWLTGIGAALRALPSLRGCDFVRLVRDRDAIDKELVLEPYAPYGEKLAESLRFAAARQGREIAARELQGFADGMAAWPPFSESAGCLHRLAARHRLAILSNVETRVLAASIGLLDARPEFFVTAEQVCSYKPARAHFDEALRRSGVARERVLHVACSLFHDVRPALRLGWHVAWIDREGESPASNVAPDLVTPDLTSLCDLLHV